MFLLWFPGCLLGERRLFEMCTIWDVQCMHIINTCAAWQRCESESFSTKWSASRERSKEICSCQGSVRQRLLLEIFWKNHTFEGLVLCCLRISSSDQWNQKRERRTWVEEFWCWDGHRTSVFFFFFVGKAGDEPFYLILNREEESPSFLFWHTNMYHTIKAAGSLMSVCVRTCNVQKLLCTIL